MSSTDNLEESVTKIVEIVRYMGGSALIVGGAVRDFVMYGGAGVFDNASDIDLEIFGLEWGEIKHLLTHAGFAYDEVGEQFCVLKIKGLPIDISIPRREKSTGVGHKNFDVIGDPHMSFEDAARRRDFTMNAMGYDPLTNVIVDPYGGRRDIDTQFIQHTSEAFFEDPLRVLRAARFAARYDFVVSAPTAQACEDMNNLAPELPFERIWMEMEKALLQSIKPSRFFRELNRCGWLYVFPGVEALIGVDQDPGWHPEGDVFEHTMHALDYWAKNLKTGDKEDDLVVALSVLCHDFGKVSTTEFVDGKIRARGHEEAGAEPTEKLLHSMRQYELAKNVVPIVENHLYPLHVENFSARGIRRLSTRVDRIDLLTIVSRADVAGRPPIDPADSFAKIDEFEAMVKKTDVPVGGPKRLATGDMLIEMGLFPGPEFKHILDNAYEAQLDGIVFDADSALEYLHAMLDGPMNGYGN
jgi:tRNA nucleotidyltransferase (CCA-adding enzyme)